MIGIYKITSPNKRIYIGQSVDIKKRWKQHKYNKLDTILHRSFNKYGFNNHIFEVIEQCNIELLNERERYWQDFYNVLENGLNSKLTKTDDKSGFISSECKLKLKISKTHKKSETEYVFEHEYLINDYEERIFEYNEKREKEEKEFESEIKRQIKQIKNDIEFYYLKLDEERQREQDSIDCDNFMNKKKRTD
jgi:group I intron endonuclease